jgi:hypothetical protein
MMSAHFPAPSAPGSPGPRPNCGLSIFSGFLGANDSFADRFEIKDAKSF